MTDDTQTPGLIPDQLLSNIKKGNCVLFLGADLPLGYEGAPLSRPELAAALAQKHGLPRGLPWPETAQAYLGKFTGDAHGLISFVAERCSGPKIKPGPLHEAIARAGFRAIVTAWYDDLLEETLRHAGYRVNWVVRDTQLPYAHEGECEAIVIKLYGCLSDPESLVLSTWDHKKLMNRLSRKLELVTSFCTLRPPLFVGFDLADDTPMDLYVRASTNMVEHMRRSYAVWPRPLDAVQAVWQGQNVEFVRADAAAFLQALAAQVPPIGPSIRGAIHVRRPPYKFLDYYEPEDADIFCGRDTESQIVTRLALSHRLLTLFGPSGAGKTSLLLAGVLPRLTPEGYKHVHVRALDAPLPAVRKAVAARAGRDDWEAGADPSPGSGQALRAFLKEMLSPKDKLVVVLDQFEELFLRVGSQQRAAFFRELAAALDQPEREVRFIFSLREDYLARLDEARDELPDVFANSFRLAALDRANARVAITEPAARAGVTVEAALVDALVGIEGKEAGGQPAGDLVEADGRVPPAALQIVLDRLYREALPPSHAPGAPPPPGLTLTMAAYRAVRHRLGEGEEAEELAGAKAILAGYVGEGLARLPNLKREDDQTPLGADPALGRAILKVMVTSQATKAALPHDEILVWLDEASIIQASDEADQKAVKNTRLGLERVRLLRGFERDGVAFYELAHDHLAAEIATWISQEEMQAKLARELLRREMDNWRGAGLLIRPEVLALIHERRKELRRLSADELELLFRSALVAGYEAVYWFERTRKGGVDVDGIALESLRSDNFRIRAAAMTALEQLGERFVEDIIGMLTDEYPQVRVAAIAALERLRPEGAWRRHLKYECYVPAGEFIMGDDGSESDYNDREVPAHKVFVDAFYISKYPVTNADYKRYMDDIGRPFELPAYRADHPVTGVSWRDAWDYAAWAGMRLLTEAEWEKAASWEVEEEEKKEERKKKKEGPLPDKKRMYPWGDAFVDNRCNAIEAGIGDTTPVRAHSPAGDSSCGCVDMAGNVWEWCNTTYQSYPYRADDGRELISWTRINRVLRGGSFIDSASSVRCASRACALAHVRSRHTGFRVGRSVSPPFKFDDAFFQNQSPHF